MNRCDWSTNDPLYIEYHDNEWGVPVFDDQKLFEFLTLETFQAGLSWITVLRKRENFRHAFDNFDYHKIASYKEEKIKQLLNDTGIIRNKLKINAAITNAQAFIKVREEFGTFSKY
ncbi:MAG: DNA-3-methyladenine glycosylase I, partial [Bacteroidales bacterium]|nr:DNA-3-methyladenine glycosylase I [Bacteroidales bacterium]